jgi:hypothetical protein
LNPLNETTSLFFHLLSVTVLTSFPRVKAWKSPLKLSSVHRPNWKKNLKSSEGLKLAKSVGGATLMVFRKIHTFQL